MSISAVTGNTSRSAAARRCCSRYTRFLSTDHRLDEIGFRDRSALRTLSYSARILGSSKGFISRTDRFFFLFLLPLMLVSSDPLKLSTIRIFFHFPPQYNFFLYILDKIVFFFFECLQTRYIQRNKRNVLNIDFQIANSITIEKKDRKVPLSASRMIKNFPRSSLANYIISNPTYYERIVANLMRELPFKKNESSS